MSDPIDLDLVELRCRLRGWKCERGYRCVRVYKSGTRRFTAIADTGQVGPNRWEEERSCEAFDGDEEVADVLTAPRWTPERLRAAPPEGWSWEKDSDSGVESLAHAVDPSTGRFHLAYVIHEDVEGGVRWQLFVPCSGSRSDELAELAKELAVASALALVLAEVAAS